MFKKIYKNKDYTSFLEGYFMIFNPLKHISASKWVLGGFIFLHIPQTHTGNS